MKWYRLTPENRGLPTLILELEADEVEEWVENGYKVEEVVILTVFEYKRINK